MAIANQELDQLLDIFTQTACSYCCVCGSFHSVVRRAGLESK